MFPVIEHIEYLLLSNDCVVVPGLGAFIAQQSAPVFSHEGHCIVAPSRMAGFNAAVTHDDGLLATSISRQSGITYTQALQEIQQAVQQLHSDIAQNGQAACGALGFFKRNNDGDLEFVGLHNDVCNLQNFGLLTSMAFDTVAQRQALQVRPAAGESAAQQLQPRAVHRLSSQNKVLRLAASVAILVAMLLVFSTPVAFNQRAQYASVSVPVKAAEAQPSWAGLANSQPTKLPTLFIAKPAETTGAIPAENNQTGRYFLVVGTVTSAKQAKQFIAAHRDIAAVAKTVAAGKFHHIYVSRSNSYGTLLKQKKQLPAAYHDAWIRK